MLVRADLFHELGGFDPATFPGSDDLDLCWRARLAGARVLVAPDARVRHRRSTVQDTRPTSRNDQGDLKAFTRSRVRVLTKSYSPVALLWVLPLAFLLNVAEAIALVFTRRPARARALLAGWFSAFGRGTGIRSARASTQRLRRVDDGDVRDLMVRGSARVRDDRLLPPARRRSPGRSLEPHPSRGHGREHARPHVPRRCRDRARVPDRVRVAVASSSIGCRRSAASRTGRARARCGPRSSHPGGTP